MYNRNFTEDEIEKIVNCCLKELRGLDKYLLDKKVNERTITHKLAEYLQQHFPEFNVDCEYNRYLGYRKRIRNERDRDINISNLSYDKLAKLIWENREADTLYPDIIIHQRGIQENNLLVIEVKKSSNPDDGEFDKKKIKELMQQPFNYKFGLFLRINLDDENDNLEFISPF